MINICEFTASYINSAHNFKILGIGNANFKNDDTQTGFACVLLNMLQRSEKNARPSNYLIDKLGTYNSEVPFYILDKTLETPNWDRTIKGAEDGNNPAKEFFYSLWTKHLPEYSWVRQYVLPEANMGKILQDYTGDWKNQSVDFYIPAIKLVIEIDGAQHKEHSQAKNDKERDRALNAAGVIVIRFPVTCLKNDEADDFESLISQLKNLIDESALAKFFNNQDVKAKEYALKIQYEQIIRYQILLLTLINKNIISVHQDCWQFNISKKMQQTFKLAAEDLFIWFENLYILKKDDFSRPEIIFGSSNEFISIENNVFSRENDATKIKGISIVTDYYDDIDYFHVATNGALIKYEVDWPVNTEQDNALKFALSNIFGYNEFKNGQLMIIANALCLRDTIGVLPTGGGKSLCYFFCCMLQPAPSYTVCPIISLLRDQEKNLKEFGITRVTSISSSQNEKDKYKHIQNFGNGKYLFIWVSPERFQNKNFRDSLDSANKKYMLSYAVIDEVHCLSEWGHDFRTSYLTLIDTIRKYTPQVTLLGLTATASQAVLTDLKIEFGIDSSGVKAVHSLERTNLSMKLLPTSKSNDKITILNNLITDKNFANKDRLGMVFSANVSNKEKLGCKQLIDIISKLRSDLTIDTFHGKLNDTLQKNVQNRFMNNEIDLIIATKAFGMGINKPNVRYTIHYGMPMSIESFYQEAGRAGRDGEDSDCYIVYDPEQESNSLNTLFKRESSNDDIKAAKNKMHHDLDTQFYFWLSNNPGVKNDTLEVKWIIEKYYNTYMQHNPIDFNCEDHKQLDVERALYHLKLLGVVKDWTIEQYENNYKGATINIEFDNFDETTVHNSFLNYIKRYDPLFEEEAHSERNKKYFDYINDSSKEGLFLRKHAYALISWIYDHIGYTRRIAINNMRELCDKYILDSDSDNFRKEIENYLKIDEKNGLLDAIVDNPSNWKLWFEAFEDIYTDEGRIIEKPLTYEGYDSLRMVVARYIESYVDNPGLNLIYLVSRAITNTFDKVVDYEGLDSLVKTLSLSELFHDNIEDIIANLLDTFKENKRNENVKLFSERICNYMPEYAEKIYNCLEDDYSLNTYLSNVTTKINSIMGRINND